MFQFGFGLVSDTSEATWWMDILRTVFSTIDTVVYSLISFIYQVLFNIADSTIISSSVVKDFYGRIQLILGIIMIFKLSISILQVIINPDLLTDPKKGTGKIISRIVIMLALFTAIIPLNIPASDAPDHSYNAYLNDNGLLFGTLYSLQYRILSNNTLEKFVFGNSKMTSGKTKVNAKTSGDRMAAYILRGFIRPNLKADANKKGLEDTKNYVCKPDDKISNESDHIVSTVATVGGVVAGAAVGGATIGGTVGSIVPGIGTVIGGAIGGAVGAAGGWVVNTVRGFFDDAKVAGVYTIYASSATTAGNILDLINTQCDDGYAFTYFPIISTACGIFILLALIGSCVDIAIRAIKLAILRLIAPIPIISYIDPKSSENGSFANWVKMLTSTYIDLFVRLLIVFFVLFIVESIMDGGLDLPLGYEDGIVGVVSTIFIIVGLFYFIKQAPKFIKDALGLKGAMGNVGLSGILGGAAALTGGAGLKGALAAGMNSAEGANMAAAQGKPAPPAWQSGSDLAAQIRTGDPKARGGISNQVNDRLMRDAGIRKARQYGVTANGLESAKNNMFAAQDAAAEEKDLYDRFTKGKATEADLRAWASKNNATYDSASGNMLMKDKHGNNITTSAREAIYKNMHDLNINAAKAKTNYEEGKKFADTHRITPTFEEEHRRSLRESLPGNDRPDMYTASGRNTAHQNITDRIVGSPENYAAAGSPRNDNRWDPGSSRGYDNNQVAGNVQTNINAVGRENGPGPGGPPM